MDNNIPIANLQPKDVDQYPCYTNFKKYFKWICYEIVACLIPWLFGLFFVIITQYEINIYEVTGDFLLAAFAIGINLKGYELKNRKDIKIHPFFLDVYKYIALGISILSALIYIALFNVDYISYKVKHSMRDNRGLYIGIYVISCICIILETVIYIIYQSKINKAD